MTKQFSINEYDINTFAENGHGRLTAKINGYWSQDPITVYVDRKINWKDETQTPEWEFRFSHSSGGRDTKEVESDIEAATNFAHAMIGLTEEANMLSTKTDILEASFQKFYAMQKAEAEAQEKAKQDNINTDTPVGYPHATALIDMIKTYMIKNSFNEQHFPFYTRGEASANYIKSIYRNKITFSFNGRAINRNDLCELIAKSSYRSIHAIMETCK